MCLRIVLLNYQHAAGELGVNLNKHRTTWTLRTLTATLYPLYKVDTQNAFGNLSPFDRWNFFTFYFEN
jgi:hypothetical protein